MIRLDKSILKFTLNPLNKQQLITNPSFSVTREDEASSSLVSDNYRRIRACNRLLGFVGSLSYHHSHYRYFNLNLNCDQKAIDRPIIIAHLRNVRLICFVYTNCPHRVTRDHIRFLTKIEKVGVVAILKFC